MKPARILLSLFAGLAVAISAQAVPTQLSADAGEIRDIRYASGSGGAAGRVPSFGTLVAVSRRPKRDHLPLRPSSKPSARWHSSLT